MEKLAITDLDLNDKRVLVRVDFNVPMKGTTVSDDTRLRASIPTIQHILDAGGLPVLMSHLGRPEGQRVAELSLEPVGRVLQTLLGREVVSVSECVGQEVVAAVKNAETGTVILLENLRFHKEEEENAPGFAIQLAELGDVYVNDAFGTAHRAHASTEGVTHYFSECAAGLLMQKELDYLGNTRSGPLRERIAYLNESILSRLEQHHQVKAVSDGPPERVKSLRHSIIHKAEQLDNLPPDRGSYFRGLEQDMDDLFFVMQLYSYPGDYLRKNPTIQRLAETIDKLEEDILGLDLPNVRGSRRAEIQFGEPIQVNSKDKRRDEVAKLTLAMQASVQSIIDQLNVPDTEH